MTTYNGEYATIEVKSNGDMWIIPTDVEGIRELADSDSWDRVDHVGKMCDVLEDIFCNSELEIIAPYEVGALVSDTCLIIGITHRDDHGEITEIYDLWWLSDYAIVDEIADLLEGKTVVLSKA